MPHLSPVEVNREHLLRVEAFLGTSPRLMGPLLFRTPKLSCR
jgi:hypothetical protein